MRRTLLTALLALLPFSAWADSDVPSLSSGTSLTSAVAYFANAGSSNTKLGFSTLNFGVSAGSIIIPAASITVAQLVSSSTTVNGQTCALGGTCTITVSATPAGSNGDIQINSSGSLGALTPGTGISTFLATPSSANLAAAVTNETGTGVLVFNTNPTLVGATLTGTLALGTQTVSGGFTMSGVPIMTGLSAGTQVSCLGLDSGNHVVLNAAACGSGGGGSITVTGGGNTQTSVTTAAFGNGFTTTNGSSGTAPINLTVIDTTKSGDYTVLAADMANALTLTGTHTLTLPTASSTIFAPGMSLSVRSTGVWTVTNSTGLTYTGPTTLRAGMYGTFVANADGASLDFFGLSVASTTVLGGVMVDGSSITISNGVISATTGGSGTVTVVGSGNLTSNALVTGGGSQTLQTVTTGTGIVTALGVNVGSAGAPVLFNGALGTPSSGTLTNATGLPAASVVAGALANGMTATTQSAASNDTKVATDAYVDAKQFSATIGWIATVNPTGALVFVAPAALTIKSIVGNVEAATGGAATVSVFKAASGTACGSGTIQHSGSFNANGTAATNQTLTLAGGSDNVLASGNRICITTTGTTSWTGGTGIGGITVNYTVP